MRNPFLSNFGLSDRAFRVTSQLPRGVQNFIVENYVGIAKKRLDNRNFPDRLTVFITDQCNLRCEHCFISKGQPKSWEMHVEHYEKLFASLKGRVAQMLLTGGEPTIRQDFGDILMLADKVGGIGTATIFTNGLLWTRLETVLHRILSEGKININLQTSIDGLADFHDKHRGQQGAFKKTMKMIQMASELKKKNAKRMPRLIVTTSISKANIGELREIVRTTAASGGSPAFTFVRGSHDGVREVDDPTVVSFFEPDDYHHYLTPVEMREAIKIIDEELWSKDPNNLQYAFNRTTLQGIARSLEEETGQVACRMGQADLVILSGGDVARCEMLKTFANLRDYDWDLEKLMKSEAYTGFMQKTNRCWCTHDCGMGVTILYEPRMLKNLYHSEV